MSQRQYPAANAGVNDALDERLRESVSALMDGEARELELRQLLAEEHREAVNSRWQRYHLVREVLQGDQDTVGVRQLDISGQVRDAIAGEAIPGVQTGRAWLKPVASFAVAASVALGIVVGLQGLNQTAPGVNPPAATAPAVATNRVYPVDGGSMQAALGDNSRQPATTYNGPLNSPLPGAMAASSAAAEREAQQRLDKYLLRHTENAALNNGQGVISFARVASFETE